MRAYEVLVILDPSLEEKTVQPSLDKYLNVVRNEGGSVENIDVWGRRRLAYEIDHKQDAVYHLVNFDCQPATLDEVSRILRITDGVMRHMAVRRIASRDGGRGGAVGSERYAANTRSQEEE